MRFIIPNGSTFEVSDVSVKRKHSILLWELYKDEDPDYEYEVFEQNTHLVSKVVYYLNHLESNHPTTFPNSFVIFENRATPWEQKFVADMSFHELQEFAVVAEYFMIESLVSLILMKIANELHRNTEIQDSTELGLSPAEKAYLRRRFTKYQRETTMASTVVKS